jgi:hypothetical protein
MSFDKIFIFSYGALTIIKSCSEHATHKRKQHEIGKTEVHRQILHSLLFKLFIRKDNIMHGIGKTDVHCQIML